MRYTFIKILLLKKITIISLLVLIIFSFFKKLKTGFIVNSNESPSNQYYENNKKNSLLEGYLVNSEDSYPKDFYDKIKALDLSKTDKISRNKKLRICIANADEYFGECQSIKRLKKAFIKDGNIEFICLHKNIMFLVGRINPHLFLSLRPETPPIKNKNIKNILIVHFAPDKIPIGLDSFCCYDGFLNVTPDIKMLEKHSGRTLIKKKFLLSCEKTKFRDLQRTKLFFCGANADKRRSTDLLDLYKFLDKTQYTEFYGLKSGWEPLNLTSYKGEIDNYDDLVDKIGECGIALVIHSGDHFKDNVTTSRIFEASASSSLVICDELPFVKENFKDSVLYIDINASNKEIFEQINKHVMWAKENPKEAQQKAFESHKIFVEKFSLEKQVQKIKELYNDLCST